MKCQVVNEECFYSVSDSYFFKAFIMGRGSGFGKVILFGEHFVVHGVPGIVSAVDSTADAEVRKTGKGIIVKDERKGAKGYAEEKKTQQLESIDRILMAIGIEPKTVSLSIILGGTLPGFSGLGASAASSVAIARAVSEEFGKELSDERINEVAYEAEKAYAGTPSGIDNTAATYGGLLWFRKNTQGDPNTVERLSIMEPVEIIIGSTGIVANTKEMVAGVTARKKNNPEEYDLLFKEAKDLVFAGRRALEEFNLRKVGILMNENHRLLQEIGVSCKELDFLVNLAREKGAFGAKVTGGGGGGCMTALTPTKTLQETVAKGIEKAGFEVLRTKIGVEKI
jgi:mevalonate kinase